ncbi:type III secretion system chaperone [Vibrio harveyi]|uniref:type III secretion system chaperone n=1 Tax=Vibrio harveyi TaxID=669 RepID=UPI001EFD3D73|nr:type III secretion system chaperone [Vibrio harveyi]MCG9671563.1 type III secretion system chaperone [Vibrio harveyi]
MSTLIEQLFQELVTDLGIDTLQPNEDGHCTLMVDETLLLDIELDPKRERLILTSLVGPLSSQQGIKQLSSLMQFNKALYKELNMSLSLETHTASIVLTYSVDAGLCTVFDLESALSCFISQTEKCRHLLESTQEDSTPKNSMLNTAICV